MMLYGIMEICVYTHRYVWHSPSASGLTHCYNYSPYTHWALRVHKINILDRCMIMGVLCILLGVCKYIAPHTDHVGTV